MEHRIREQDWHMFYYDKLLAESDKAYYMNFGERENFWIPISQTRNLNREKGTIELTEWIAKEKGLI